MKLVLLSFVLAFSMTGCVTQVDSKLSDKCGVYRYNMGLVCPEGDDCQPVSQLYFDCLRENGDGL